MVCWVSVKLCFPHCVVYVFQGPFDGVLGFSQGVFHPHCVVCVFQGPFDGVLGFSQGASMVSLLCGLQEQQSGAKVLSVFFSDFDILLVKCSVTSKLDLKKIIFWQFCLCECVGGWVD